MNSFYKKTNNYYPSCVVIHNTFLNSKSIKNSRNKILNKEYINKNVRQKKLLSFQFLIHTNEINKFSLNGIIVKKNKQYNLNNSITVRSLLSGKYVFVNFHLFSNGIRLM
jgi:hypothetical protein